LASTFNVAVSVEVRSLLGVKLADNLGSGETIRFDVKARMEEKERRSGRVAVKFSLSVGTKPSVAKFEVEGIAILEGRDSEIEKMLEVDPETQVPYVFQRVYQHVFMSMYLLSTLIDAPYPPPNLLFSRQQQVPVASISQGPATSEKENTQAGVVVAAAPAPEEESLQPGQESTKP
jgi:hypothetical protein